MLYERTMTMPVAEVTKRLGEAVQANGFGVVGEIDLAAKIRSKGVAFERECIILEVCNPRQAKEVLESQMRISTALPCRISVYEEGGVVKVVTIKPTAMLAMFGAAELEPVARDVEETMLRIIDTACA